MTKALVGIAADQFSARIAARRSAWIAAASSRTKCTGGTSDITYQMAGERGWGIFVPPLLPWGVLEGPLNIYKKACAEHPSDFCQTRDIVAAK